MTDWTINGPGHRDDMPEAIYHADPVEGGSLSCSMAKLIIRPAGPAKLRQYLDGPREYKKVFDYGQAAHALVLGCGAELVAIPDEILASNGAISTKAAKDFVAEARDNGQLPLKSTDIEHIKAMALQLVYSSDAMAIIEADHAEHEVSAFRVDEVSGVWLRCRFDTIAPAIVGDYKTTVDANPATFARKAYDLGYHMQHAWYLDMSVALGLTDPDAPFKFVAQEKEAPYCVSVVQLDDDYLAIGRRDNRRAIDLYAECVAADTWPGYPSGTHVVAPPPWAIDEVNSTLDPTVEAELLALIEGSAA